MNVNDGPHPYRTDGRPCWLTVRQALAFLAERGQPCSESALYTWARTGEVRAERVTVRGRQTRSLRVLTADVERLIPAPPVEAPAPPAVERVRALLPELSADERRQIAVEALTLT